MQLNKFINRWKEGLKRLRALWHGGEVMRTNCTRCDATLIVLRADFQRVEDGLTQSVALCPKCANAFQNWYTAGRCAVV